MTEVCPVELAVEDGEEGQNANEVSDAHDVADGIGVAVFGFGEREREGAQGQKGKGLGPGKKGMFEKHNLRDTMLKQNVPFSHEPCKDCVVG